MKDSGLIINRDKTIEVRFWSARSRYKAIVADYQITTIPADIRKAFREFEERVSDQLFSHLEDLEKVIDGLELSVQWADEQTWEPIYDLQIMSAGLSFRTGERAKNSPHQPE